MELSNYARMFKALSNEQRLQIFMTLYKNSCSPEGAKIGSEFRLKGEQCCPVADGIEKAFTRICDCMSISRSTISHHFKELQSAGLITCERDGQHFRCSVNQKAVEAMRRFLE